MLVTADLHAHYGASHIVQGVDLAVGDQQQRRFVVGTGVGAKRILASSEDRERVGLDRAEFTGRFTIGIAF